MIRRILKKAVVSVLVMALVFTNSSVLGAKAETSQIEADKLELEVKDAETVVVDNYEYTIQSLSDTTCKIVFIRVLTGAGEKLVIPEELNGKKVTKIKFYDDDADNTYSVFGVDSDKNTVFDTEDDFYGNKLKLDVIKKIVIPDSVEEISKYAFVWLENLEEVRLSESLKKVSYGIFDECDKLTKIRIPKSLTKNVEDIARWKEWKEFKIAKDNPAYKMKKGMLLSRDGKVLYAVVIKKDAYNSKKCIVIPKGVKKIVECNVTKACKEIHIPATVRKIGKYAFGGVNCKVTLSSKNKVFAKDGGCIYTKKGKKLVVIEAKKNEMIISNKVRVLPDGISFTKYNVQKLVIPESVRIMKKNWVSDLFNIYADVYFEGKKPPKIEAQAMGISWKLHVPAGAKKVYKKWLKKLKKKNYVDKYVKVV